MSAPPLIPDATSSSTMSSAPPTSEAASSAAAAVAAGSLQPALVTTSQPLPPDTTPSAAAPLVAEDPFAPGGMFALPELENAVDAGAGLTTAGKLQTDVPMQGLQDTTMSEALAALPLPELPPAPVQQDASVGETVGEAGKSDGTAADAAADAPVLTPIVQPAPPAAAAQATPASTAEQSATVSTAVPSASAAPVASTISSTPAASDVVDKGSAAAPNSVEPVKPASAAEATPTAAGDSSIVEPAATSTSAAPAAAPADGKSVHTDKSDTAAALDTPVAAASSTTAATASDAAQPTSKPVDGASTSASSSILPPVTSASAAPSTSATLTTLPALPTLVTPSLPALLASPIVPTAASPTPSAATLAAAAAQAKRDEALQREREAEEKKEREAQEVALREADEMRLLWLSLPSNDHPTYYSDTSGSSEPSSPQLARHPQPRAAKGRTAFLPASGSARAQPLAAPLEGSSTEEEDDFSELDEEEEEDEEKLGRRHRTGNRGNKLKRKEGARWVRRGKLGSWTEARGDKEMNDRVRLRIASLQRAGVRSLLTAAPSPHLAPTLDVPTDDLLPPSSPPPQLTSTALAPALLRPVLTPRALLESHTLRHTFRNPHIAALSKTALDLRESEGGLSRALGRCFAELERFDWLPEDMGEDEGAAEDENEAEEQEQETNGDVSMKSAHSATNGEGTSAAAAATVNPRKRRRSVRGPIDADAIGAEGTNLTSDELNPSFGRLDELFVTPGGLPIPLGSDPNATAEEAPTAAATASSSSAAPPAQAVLSVTQQRDVVRAALDCLHELSADSREYVERLDEVRARLAAVKRERAVVWDALRSWALAREVGEDQTLPQSAQVGGVQGAPRTPLSAQGRNGEEAKRAGASSTGGKNKKSRLA